MDNVLIIGGGLMGMSTAWKLAEREVKVTLVEQGNEVISKSSSIGTARIARSLGPKKDVFSYAHNTTIKEVSKLIEFLNDKESTSDHSIDDIYTTLAVNYLFHKDDYLKVKKLRFKKQKNDFRRASTNSSFRKFGMSIPKDTIMVRERRQYSGSMNPSELINKLRLGIEKKNGIIKYEKKVIALRKKANNFEVEILDIKTQKTETLIFQKVVVAAGAYSVEILKEFAPYFNKLITPKRIAISLLKIKDKCYETLTDEEKIALQNGFPMFSQIGKEYFALITESGQNTSPIIKAGGHQKTRNIHNLNKIWEQSVSPKERKWIRKKFLKHLKMLEIHLTKNDIEEVDSYNCVYSLTRNNFPIVSPIFNKYGSLDSNIVVVGGMSGIGAKGCLCYGSFAADQIQRDNKKQNKMYRKMERTFGNPAVNLNTKRRRPGRLF